MGFTGIITCITTLLIGFPCHSIYGDRRGPPCRHLDLDLFWCCFLKWNYSLEGVQRFDTAVLETPKAVLHFWVQRVLAKKTGSRVTNVFWLFKKSNEGIAVSFMVRFIPG